MKKILGIVILALFISHNLYAEELKKVSVQILWKHQFEFAGFYVAQEKGYYKDIGIDLEVKEFENNININEEVASGHSQYGVLRPSSLIDISKGKEIIYLAALYQTNPLMVLANKDSNITSISDFNNKKIMITQDHITDSSLVAMFRSQGVDLKNLTIVEHTYNPKSLLNGETDLMASYISNEPYYLKELGGEPVIFSPKDYGFDFYANLLSVNKEYLNKNPKEVEDFTHATIKGFEYAFNNIEEVVNLVYKKYNSLNKSKEAIRHEAMELKKLAYYNSSDFGVINLKKLEKIYDVYKLFGLAQFGLNLDDIVYNKLETSSKLNSIEKEYLKNKKHLGICISPEWRHPFIITDKHGKSSGIVMDYLDILSSKMQVSFDIIRPSSWDESLERLKKGTCEIFPLALRTRKNNMSIYTEPYISFPIVILTKKDISFVNGLDDLKNKKIAIQKNSYLKHHFRYKDYALDTIEVKDAKEGFKQVDNSEVFAFVDTLPTIIYHLQNSHYSDSLKISGRFTEPLELALSVRKDSVILLGILQKMLDSISNKDKQNILNTWLPIEYSTNIDYTLVIKILMACAILISLFLYWNRKITLANRLLKAQQKEIEIKNKTLNKLVITDGLTQLLNRQRIEFLINQHIKTSNKNGSVFGLCMVDIDHFKSINDNYGHPVGDIVLTYVARTLEKYTRVNDFVGRWGGEEFMIIFSCLDPDNLKNIVENIRQQVEKLEFDEFEGNITISAGASLHVHDDDLTSLIKRVDNALYEAKHKGRNCSVIV